MAAVERTEDGRFVVVGGRRWRATDPHIPQRLRQELVTELMDARRAVKAASRDSPSLGAARRRVHHAKVALGERGAPWWEPPAADARARRVRAAILALLSKRGAASSICPSDAARISASPDWRPVMPLVRDVAADLAETGDIIVTQGERVVDDVRGVSGAIRLRLAPDERQRQNSSPRAVSPLDETGRPDGRDGRVGNRRRHAAY